MYSEDFERPHGQERNAEDVYSKPVRAGKRTYFFDVKTTKGNNDYYLTITESKRRQERDGSFTYDKHKIFLYTEDFEKFQEGRYAILHKLHAGMKIFFRGIELATGSLYTAGVFLTLTT